MHPHSELDEHLKIKAKLETSVGQRWEMQRKDEAAGRANQKLTEHTRFFLRK